MGYLQGNFEKRTLICHFLSFWDDIKSTLLVIMTMAVLNKLSQSFAINKSFPKACQVMSNSIQFITPIFFFSNHQHTEVIIIIDKIYTMI